MPVRPDSLIPGSGDLTWTLAMMDTLAPLVDGFVMPTPFVNGTWDADKLRNRLQKSLIACYRAVHAKAEKLGKKIKPMVSNAQAMSNNPLHWGYDSLKVVGKIPVNVRSLLGSDTAGLMSSLPDKRKFIDFHLPPGGEDRHFTLQIAVSGKTALRIYQPDYGNSKFVQVNVAGTQTLNFSLPNVLNWRVLLIRESDAPVTYSIDSWIETPPLPGQYRTLNDSLNWYAWFGNGMAFEIARTHGLFDGAHALRTDAVLKFYYDSIAAPYQTFDGFSDYLNEPPYFDQQSIDRLPGFQQHVAATQFTYTGKPMQFWFDCYDTLTNG